MVRMELMLLLMRMLNCHQRWVEVEKVASRRALLNKSKSLVTQIGQDPGRAGPHTMRALPLREGKLRGS